jgi:Anaphase-promoting complex subunit 4 WD40 domain
MSGTGSSTMSLIATKTLAEKIHSNMVACCPTMDLIAVATTDNRMDVYRFSGQRVFGLHRKDAIIQSLCWKYNGEYNPCPEIHVVKCLEVG